MKKVRAYEKLIKDIKKELEQLEVDIDAIPDISLINIVVCFLEHNFFNPTQIKDLYSRLNKLKAKAQSGLDYYEMGARKKSLEMKADQESDNKNEININQEASTTNQELNTSQEADINEEASTTNQEVNTSQEADINKEASTTNQETTSNQESDSIEESYYSQLIDLLADINYLEKRLRQKENNLSSIKIDD